MDRFRANIVIAGATPWAEDTWKRLRIGGVDIHVQLNMVPRCIIPTIDQRTGEAPFRPVLVAAARKALAPAPPGHPPCEPGGVHQSLSSVPSVTLPDPTRCMPGRLQRHAGGRRHKVREAGA